MLLQMFFLSDQALSWKWWSHTDGSHIWVSHILTHWLSFDSHRWAIYGFCMGIASTRTELHTNWYEVDLDLALLKGTSHAKWLKLNIATKAQRCVCVFQCGMDHTNWVWHNLGFMTETRCVCMSAFCFERRSAVTGDLIPHAVGRKWRVFCVCVCVATILASHCFAMSFAHPLHSIGELMSYDGIRCRGKLFWHVCVFLLCSESRLHAA